ncbi:O-antigen and teichoic acid export-like membrane protein [Methylobacterium sp. GXF4]|jgi:O-antigen/teichoic acid export membrane protein|uniref:lipopolysaccharide biosynthesis protein n=1 Tax=Methylobacterium sp. GXF4 TaxID=1096546 RepID=UPI0002697D25|nr:polysaccharide biosynthesis C-terminal domain-containing protein [Methylobacterium sp. GXF4]EIZ82251.1 O-antigen and teichoic acid export-like membrane protein [Methylobacterium sp. GXF4]MDF2599720.1 teichoic acid transporter [Methylobacterium brachiatum]
MAVIAAFVINAGLNFVLGLLIAQLLGPADFGRFALATTGAVVLNTVLFEWLRLSATRFYSGRVRVDEPWIRHGLDRAYLRIGLLLLGAAALCGAFGFGGDGAGGREAVLCGTGLAALGIGVFDYHAALARARFDGKLYLGLVAVKNVLAFILMAAAAWWLPQPAWVLAAAGLSQLAAVILLRHPLRDPAMPFERPRLTATWGIFARYGLPLIAANTAYQCLAFVNRGAIAGHAGFAEAGYFALAADVTSRSLMTLGTALDLLLFQFAVQAEEQHGRAAAEAQVAENAGTVFALLAPCAVGFWAVLPALQGLVVPDAYRGPFERYSVALMPGLFCLAMMFYALNPVFQIRRRTLPVIAAALVGLAVNGAGLLLLPALMGGMGVALAQTLGLAAAALWLGWRALTGSERIVLPWGQIGAAALACGAMGLALAPFRHLPPAAALAVLVPAGAALYGALVWIFDIAGLRRQVVARLRPNRTIAAG